MNAQAIVVPRPSVNTWHIRVPSAVGCCGVFLAPTVLRLGSATMTLRRYGRLSGASRQCGPYLWAIALLSLARRRCLLKGYDYTGTGRGTLLSVYGEAVLFAVVLFLGLVARYIYIWKLKPHAAAPPCHCEERQRRSHRRGGGTSA